MSHDLAQGDAIHCPSVAEIRVLNDIGWNASTATVGINDVLSMSGYGPYGAPQSILNVGSTYEYWPNFISYSGDHLIYSTVSWRLELYAQDGIVPIASNPSGGTGYWTTPAISLPSGHVWLRDLNNRIQGKLTIMGSDDHSPTHIYHHGSVDVGVNAVPDKPIISVEGSITRCSTRVVKFYAAGAKKYQVYSQKWVSGAWGPISMEVLPEGKQSFAFTGLDEAAGYQFWVQAINDAGSSYSDKKGKNPCFFLVNVKPNPADLNSTLTIAIDGLVGNVISDVTITNIADPNVRAIKHFDTPASQVNIDLSSYNLSQGIYTVLVTDSDGNTSTAQLQLGL